MNTKFRNYWMIYILMSLLLFGACTSKKKGGGALFGATGKPLEMVVILPKEYNNDAVKDSIRSVFGRPIMILPQIEPMQTLMFTTQENFTAMFKTMRNVLYVSIDPEKYSQPKVSISRNDYAEGQVLIHAKADNLDGFYYLLHKRGEYLSQFIYTEELARISAPLESTYSSDIRKMVEDSIGGVTINAQTRLEYVTGKKGFVWASDQGGLRSGRSDLVVYSFPYKDKPEVTFTPEYLVNIRDSVMKLNLPGQYKGSYMATEKIIMPIVKTYKLNGEFRAEMRGLWAMEGDMMGGPFVSHAIIDQENQRVVVAEVFIYHPNDNKRNLLIYNEAALLTFRPIGTEFGANANDESDKSMNETTTDEE